jgi:hypothetical protein
MKLPNEVLDVAEVIVDASPLQKGALAFGDNVRETRRKAIGQQLGEDLGETMYKTYGSVISHRQSFRFLRDENDVSGIHKADASVPKVRHMDNCSGDVLLNDLPAALEEGTYKAIWAWRLNRRQGEDRVFNLRLAKSSIQIREVMMSVSQTFRIEAKKPGSFFPQVPLEVIQQ